MNQRYDILNRAKQKGQPALIELPRVNLKDNPLRQRKLQIVEEHRRIIREDGEVYAYVKKHPELCPPVGTIFYLRNQYGVKAKLTVKMVFAGMPGTTRELFPASEQPEHLRDKAFPLPQTEGIRGPYWVQWADSDAWERYQQQQGKPLKPWLSETK